MAATEVFENNPATTVSSGGTDAGTIGTIEMWTVVSTSGFPVAVPNVTQFHVGDPAIPSELILVTSAGGSVSTTWTVTRGAENTTPVAHAPNFTITQVVTAGWLGGLTQDGLPNPMTSLGDMISGAAGGTAARLIGNTAATKKFLTQTGTGSASAAPGWGTIATTDVPTLNQNTTGTSANVSGTVTTAHGGTGLASLTTYAVVTGGTSSTSPVQQVAGGTVGQVLTSQGASALPVWATLAGGSTTTFPITVNEGGTGGTTATAYSVLVGGTSATSPFQQVASAGTLGQVLTSQGPGALPQWGTVSGGTGGSVTFPITVNEGGTGLISATAYSVLAGGVTSTGSLQTITSAAGSIGYVLTTNGTGSLPSWQRPTGGTGISNPMTAVGDMITGGAGNPAVATRLANPGVSGAILTSNGTGAQPSWEQAPVDWINVQTAFGAAGNGIADDWPAIQNAVNSLVSTGGTGGTIYFPSGQYLLKSGSAITLPNYQTYTNLSVTFQGCANTYGCKIQQTTNNVDVIYGENVKGFILDNIQLQGPSGGAATGGIGIHLQSSGGASDSTVNVDITNCSIYETGGDGITIDNPLNVRLSRCNATQVNGNGFNLNGLVGGTGNPGTSCLIENCYAEGPANAGYLLTGIHYSAVIGTATDGGGAGYVLTECQHLTLVSPGCEAPIPGTSPYLGQGFEINNCLDVVVISPLLRANPYIAYWVTGNSKNTMLINPAEISTSGSGTVASVKVDAGSYCSVIRGDLITGTVYASGTTVGVPGVIEVGDTSDRFNVGTNGVLNWGSGSTTLDTNLYRNTANSLRTDDSLTVGTNLLVDGEAGFYGGPVVAQPTAGDITAGFVQGSSTAVTVASTFTGDTGSTKYTIGDIVNALKKLGLINS